MSKFQALEFFKPQSTPYTLLPLRFISLDEEHCVITNLSGEYLRVARAKLHQFLRHQLTENDPVYIELRARHFLIDQSSSAALDLLALKVRSRYTRLSDFTSLHMFVVTLRCEHSCHYCQVSRQSEDKTKYDMTPEVALAALDLVFRSPARSLKIEFQGGEPLLSFELIRLVVLESEKRNRDGGKDLSYVIATNLALVNEDILAFCRDHGVLISTSLDGPKALHNQNRPRPGGDSYEKTIEGIKLVRRMLGRDKVSALMTTTAASLDQVVPIIDEYIAQGFNGIFLRPLSPYGFAVKTRQYRSYDNARWQEFYKEGLEYIIDLNRRGLGFTEYYAALVLKKMLTSEDPGYVDLMSPAGVGIGGIVYNYDGYIYASDESRMLAEMGEFKFRLGKVGESSYQDVFTSPNLLDALEESFAYSVPMCTDCAFESYCGSDPVYHYRLQRDYIGRKPESDFCSRNMDMFRFLITKMEEDPFVKRLFTKWANS